MIWNSAGQGFATTCPGSCTATVTVSPDKCEVKEGKGQGEANCVLKTNGDFFLKMSRDGYTPGATDFMGPWAKAKSNDPMLLGELKKAFKL